MADKVRIDPLYRTSCAVRAQLINLDEIALVVGGDDDIVLGSINIW